MKNHNESYQFLKERKDKGAQGNQPVSFFDPNRQLVNGQVIVVPNLTLFIRDVTEHGNIGAIKIRLFKLSPLQLLQLAWWNKFNLMKLAHRDFATGLLLLIQIELIQTKNAKTSLIVLSDQVTDLAVAMKNSAILSGFYNLVTKQAKLKCAFMTNNFPEFVSVVAPLKLRPKYIFSPFSTSGYQMNPSKQLCEQALALVPSECIVAITTADTVREKTYRRSLGIDKVLIGWF